ncbi:hypothetical protein BGW80DRAFT_1438809 [Lactifluus volemus]|nr:hypothetical protein BGW80DRAFT_1438809 [Lactifluus volemus]
MSLISPTSVGIIPYRQDLKQDGVKVSTQRLWCDDVQAQAIEAHYQKELVIRQTFNSSPPSQASANALLSQNKLDLPSLEQLESRWMTVWSSTWRSEKANAGVKRILLQCKSRRDATTRQRSNEDTGKRYSPYDFTGCLAHADITYEKQPLKIRRIVGILEHNPECQLGVMTRMPSIPLHPHVIEVALAQLREGASITSIQIRNLEMYHQLAYREQWTTHPEQANFRYNIQGSDLRRIYTRHQQSQGINIKKHSPQFSKDLAECVFHYSARAKRGDRFEIFISTKDMEDAAWSYVHHSQLILDGTFGVCSSRLLLWIAMGIDPQGKGLPIALFLFSAPPGTLATHASYDIVVLTHLLRTWKNWLSSHKSANNRVFEPCVAITDTDTKERGALVATWPFIILLLCRFHVWQCWTNKRQTTLPKRDSHLRYKVLERIQNLELSLLASTNYQGTLILIDTERRWLNSLVDDEANKPYVKGGIAASRLGIPIEGVLPTTNHLESFNRVIKKKHLSYWQHSGYRLRFDVLIFHLIRHILPFVFAQVRQRDKATAWQATRFTGPAGGGTLPSKYASGVRHNQASEPLAWFEEDTRREGMAIGILQERRLLLIVSGHPSELWATCATSLSNPNLQFHERYWLTYNIKGTATCTCPDWLQRGGACKHLRAFRLHLLHQVQIGHLSSVGHFPVSLLEAQDKYAALKQEINPPTIPVLLSIYPNGYTQPIPPPMMVPSALSEIPPYKEMTDVPTLIDMELEIAAQMEMNDDTKGSDPGDNSDRNDDRSLYDSNSRAISAQLDQRIDSDMDYVLPKLFSLYKIKDLQTAIHGIQEEINSKSQQRSEDLETHDNTPGSSTSKKRKLDCPSTPPTLTRPLPPSPEERQIRKPSHKTF